MFEQLKNYYVEICLILFVLIIILYSSKVMEKFQENNKDALEEERLRYAGLVATS